MPTPRTEWKRHRWSMNFDTLQCRCTRCGLIVNYRKTRSIKQTANGATDIRERVVEHSYTFAGSRIDWSLPYPRTCRPVPEGMWRIA